MTVLHILCAGAAKGLVLAMQERFQAARGATATRTSGAADATVSDSPGAVETRFNCTFGAVGAMRDKLLAGEPCDLIILTAALIDLLVAEGRVKDSSCADLGRVHTGIAVPATQPLPDIGDPAELRGAVLDARGIYLPDPQHATAGIHFANVLRALGIYDNVRERLRPFPNGAAAMRAMADAGEPDLIGCTQVTEINYTNGVSLAGVLPREFELATTYTVAVCSDAAEPALAQEFALLLAGPESRTVRVRGGFVVD